MLREKPAETACLLFVTNITSSLVSAIKKQVGDKPFYVLKTKEEVINAANSVKGVSVKDAYFILPIEFGRGLNMRFEMTAYVLIMNNAQYQQNKLILYSEA